MAKDQMLLKSLPEKGLSMLMINQVFPVKRQVPLEGLYLDQRLMDRAAEIGRRVVLADFLTDKNGVAAKATKDAHFEIPADYMLPRPNWKSHLITLQLCKQYY